jgi:microcystin-dependent protein
MQYNQPFDQPGTPDAPFVNGNPATGTAGSIPPAAAIEYPQREIVNLITDGGLTPSNSDLHQASKAIQSGQLLYAVDTGAVNAMVASVAPSPNGLVPGMTVHIKAAATNTGATTLSLNGLGTATVHRANGAALSAGDINGGMVVELIWDGAYWQIANYFGFTSSTTNNNTYTLSIPYAADSGVANSIVAAPSPALTALSAGQEIIVKLANTNTGATTISISSLAAVPVVNIDGSALVQGQIVAGEMLWMIYDGTHFQVCNPGTGPGTTPIGGMIMWLEDTLPADGGGVGWCWANGGTLSRTGNGAKLFAQWGTRYGAGDGSTTFNVINMQEVAPVGLSGMGGAASPGLLGSIAAGVKNVLGSLFGTDTTTLTAAQIPTITVAGGATGSMTGGTTVNVDQGISGSSTGGGDYPINTVTAQGPAGVSVSGTLSVSATSNNTAGAAHNNMQPSRAVGFIIRIA